MEAILITGLILLALVGGLLKLLVRGVSRRALTASAQPQPMVAQPMPAQPDKVPQPVASPLQTLAQLAELHRRQKARSEAKLTGMYSDAISSGFTNIPR